MPGEFLDFLRGCSPKFKYQVHIGGTEGVKVEFAFGCPAGDAGHVEIFFQGASGLGRNPQQGIFRRGILAVAAMIGRLVEFHGLPGFRKFSQAFHQGAGKGLESGLAVLRPGRIQVQTAALHVQMFNGQMPEFPGAQAGEKSGFVEQPAFRGGYFEQALNLFQRHGPAFRLRGSIEGNQPLYGVDGEIPAFVAPDAQGFYRLDAIGYRLGGFSGVQQFPCGLFHAGEQAVQIGQRFQPQAFLPEGEFGFPVVGVNITPRSSASSALSLPPGHELVHHLGKGPFPVFVGCQGNRADTLPNQPVFAFQPPGFLFGFGASKGREILPLP